MAGEPELVRLVVEIDSSKVGPAAAAMRGQFGAAVKGMDADSKKAATSVGGIGDAADRAGKKTDGFAGSSDKALKLVGKSWGAVSGIVAGHERSVVKLAATLAHSFAQGGAIAAGIAAVGAGIGLIGSLISKSSEAAEEAQKAHTEWLETTKKKAEEATKALEDLQRATAAKEFGFVGINLSKAELDKIAEGRAKSLEVDAQADKVRGMDRPTLVRAEMAKNGAYGAGEKVDADIARETEKLKSLRAELEKIEASRKELAKVSGTDAAERERAADESRVDAAKKLNAALDERIRILKAESELEAELERIQIQSEHDAAVPGADRSKVAEVRQRSKAAAWAKFLSADDPEATRARDEQRKAAQEFLDILEKAHAKQQSIDDAVAGVAQGYEDALDKAKALTPEEEERVELNRKLEELLAQGATDIQLQGVETAGLAAIEARRVQREKEKADAAAKRAKEKAEAEAERAKDVREDAEKDIRKEIDLLNAADDSRRAMVELEAKIAEYRAKGVSEGLLGELRAAGMAKIQRDAAGKVNEEAQKMIDDLKSTIAGGLTDAVVDGLTNGFRNGSSIALSLVNTLLRQVIGSIISSGINAAFSGLFGGAGGGGGGGILPALVGAVGGGGWIANVFAGGVASGTVGGGGGATGGTGSC